MWRKKQKQPQPTSRRQRVHSDSATSPQSFAYLNRRTYEPDIPKKEAETVRLRNDKKQWRTRLGVAALVSGGIGVLVLLGTLTSQPTVVVYGGQKDTGLQTLDVYRQSAHAYLASSIANRFKLTADVSGLEAKLRAQHPELSSVTVSLPFMGWSPKVTIAAFQPVLALQTTSGSYVVDAGGMAVSPVTDGAKGLIPVQDQSGLPVKVGEQVLPRGDVFFIQTIVSELRSSGVGVASTTLPPGTRELSIGLSAAKYKGRFNLQSPTARQQSGTFLAVKKRLESQNTSPKEYIDVRVDGRAYYK